MPDAQAIRSEIAELVPSYRGIEKLARQGDQFQWGGPRLCEGGVFPLPEGKARFELASLPERKLESGEFWLSTRRGKQFNSIVQAEVDALTGAARDHVFMHERDMASLGLHHDQAVRVHSRHGEFRGRAFRAELLPGNVQMHWPEANVLLSPSERDPVGLVPDYNAKVRIEALP